MAKKMIAAGKLGPINGDLTKRNVPAVPMHVAEDPKIVVDSATAVSAEDFVICYLGVPPHRIDHTEDAGPVSRPERYRPGTREWHVYLKPAKEAP